MPIYEYLCQTCTYNFEQKQSIHDDALEECPSCLCKSLERVIFAPMLISNGEPRTLGTLAEKNRRKMGQYAIDKRVRDRKEKDKKARKLVLPEGASRSTLKKEKPFWRTEDKPLNLHKIKNVEKYILEGKTNG